MPVRNFRVRTIRSAIGALGLSAKKNHDLFGLPGTLLRRGRLTCSACQCAPGAGTFKARLSRALADPAVRQHWEGLSAPHSTFRELARVHRCGRATLRVVCRCLYAADINIRHCTEDGLECTQQADIDPDEDLDMQEEDAAESDLSELLSGDESEEALAPGDVLLEEEAEMDSDYEDERPPPKPAHRRGKRKRAAANPDPAE